jgi:uncharacterized protein DUF6075
MQHLTREDNMRDQWIHESIDMLNKAIYFKSPEHKDRFQAAIQLVGKFDDGLIDREYGAALYLLSHDEGTWNLAKKYVSSSGIKFHELLERPAFSTSELTIFKLAANLFYSRVDNDENIYPKPVELAWLDENNFMLAINALKLRYFGLKVDNTQ